jgi:hypothetical protein
MNLEVENFEMQVKLIIFPSENGLNVVIWGKWAEGSMRTRHFETRGSMLATLKGLGLITSDDVIKLDSFTFEDSCPLLSGEIDEQSLRDHGFLPA